MAQERADVVVIGGASAGYAAAVAARHAGAEKVIVLEKADPDLHGGNCRYSSMGFRFTHEGIEDLLQFIPDEDREEVKDRRITSYTAEHFDNDLQRVTQGGSIPSSGGSSSRTPATRSTGCSRSVTAGSSCTR